MSQEDKTQDAAQDTSAEDTSAYATLEAMLNVQTVLRALAEVCKASEVQVRVLEDGHAVLVKGRMKLETDVNVRTLTGGG